MKARMAFLTTLVLFTAATAWGQTSRPAPETVPVRPAAGATVTGTISGTDVYVRAMPSKVEGYPCLKLSAPAKVEVVEEKDGWLKILPPEGAFSLVSKDYVKTDAAAKVGTVAGANVQVRAGSDLMPSRTDCLQIKLNSGDKLTLLGEQGRFYKVAPPAGTFLYISGQYVTKPDGVAYAVAPARDPAVEPVRNTTTMAAPPTTTGPSRPSITSDQLKAENEALAAADQAWKDTYAQPFKNRDFRSLLAKYLDLNIPAESPNHSYVQAKITILQSQVETAVDVARINDNLDQTTDAVRKMDQKVKDILKTPVEGPLPKTFAAEGIITPSQLFPGGATGQKRYVVTNPETRLITAYVQCSNSSCDLSAATGCYVGVQGKPTYDKDTSMYVIEATQVVVKSKPAAPTPPTKVLPVDVKPTTSAPAVRTEPAPVRTEPAATPLPATGLPVAEPSSKPADVDSSLFD